MAKLYTLTHRQQYCKTKDTYKSNLCIVNKETLLYIAGRFGMSLPKSYSKEKMAEKLSDYVLKNPMKCLEQLSVKELEVLREAVKAGADTHVVRPNRRFYDAMRQLLLVSTFHHKKERKLYFLLPDELRELFAPLLDKAIKAEKKREKLEKANNTKPPIIEEPEYIDDDELTEYDFFDDDDDEEDEDDGPFDIPDNFFSFLNDIRGKIRQYSEEHGLNSPTYKYSCSVDLMEAIRQLPYEKKVEIVKAFYRLITLHLIGAETIYTERFEEDYNMIIFNGDEVDDESSHYIGYCINDLDNAISEIDLFDPQMFFNIAGELDKVING